MSAAVDHRFRTLTGRGEAGRDPGTRGEDRAFVLDARFSHRGTWAGIEDLVESAYLALRRLGRDDLIDRYNYALHMVLPRHRQGLALVHATLTDSSEGTERTRNFPLDRAYRIVHSLVELIVDWQREVAPTGQWTVLARGFDEAQHLSRRFFAELARRASSIKVVVETEDGNASAPEPFAELVQNELPSTIIDEQEKEQLEAVLDSCGFDLFEQHYPALLAHYRHYGYELAAARLAIRALSICNHYGYYHESGSFAEAVLPHFDAIVGDDQVLRWNLVGNIFQGLVMVGQQDRAQSVVEALAGEHLTRPDLLAKMNYVLAMVHLRYATVQDIGRAEHHLGLAGEMVAAARGMLPPDEYHFFKVFSDNGLAFLRVRQGRREEALALCTEGYALLTAELGEHRHKLHRSVLQYNAAQVYVMLDRLDDALAYYAQAAEMDPYYSEYHNEAGNILQRQERYAEALEAYDRAIAYSAPYPQVHFNKAVCHTHLEQWDEALAAFGYSLELDPAQSEALLMRAEILDALGREDEALADIETAIALDGELVTARVNRAVAYFARGDLTGALRDMDHVIAIERDEPSHYENRAEIYRAMAHEDQYLRDLEKARDLRLAA
ncbi:tetratricopeptide repeat protein [Sphingosinicella sp. BN140058]|uniref:tetratricopeptide repeat protein n=1 Tax=Sphingosinicella sp. BN140058 TaxID=1892855 RepID=UPI001011E18F|nr:tetratricopeptide repeat protein [Sphingosinicella sp. BN140058]QAY76229.1 tetratricopeptide repeat protein [Sphingosinicella sp. BN140058]